MITKPDKDPKQPTNRRPLSPLDAVSDIFESLLFMRLKFHVLPDQFGFRSHRCTTLQRLNVVDDIINSENRGEKTAAVLFEKPSTKYGTTPYFSS